MRKMKNFHEVILITIIVQLLSIHFYSIDASESYDSNDHSITTTTTIDHNEVTKSLFQYQNRKIDIRKKTTKILNNEEFEFLQNSLENIRNSKCRKDLNTTLWGIIQKQKWTIAMYDSSVKVPFGIEGGSVYQFGNFDECLNSGDIEQDDHQQMVKNMRYHHHRQRIIPKYCLADVIIDGFTVRSVASRTHEPTNSTLVHWGICVPVSCNAQDIQDAMSTIFGHEVHVNEDKCTVKGGFKITKGMILYGIIIFCFIMMTLFSTSYHLYTICKSDIIKQNSVGDFEMAIRAFSIIENLKKLFQQSNDTLGLNAINGIKALSMIFIVLGHSLLFAVGGPVLNSDFFAVDIKLLQNAFLLNSPLFVDTFLLLSGFLFCRILIKELERRQGKVNFGILYVFRYIRLTPAYFAIIAFYATWFPQIGDGPLWNSRIGLEQKRCEESWWLNLLYVNNYIGTEKLCMFQSWYLSVDTQLFILAPIVIYSLWKACKLGVTLLGALLFGTTLIPILLTYFQKLDPTLLVYADEVTDISSNTYFTQNYMKTHMRATAYVCGLIVGYLLHIIQEKSVKFSKSFVTGMWVFSTIVGIASMFSLTVFMNIEYTTLESSLYAGFHRLGWSILTGWIIIACTTGNGGFLKSILSARIFAPISRLTYCAYLTNGIVELYEAATLREPIYMSHVSLTGLALTHTIFTFGFALVLCLLFESPIHGIEKIFLRKDNQRRRMEEKKTSTTPSTSEETA